MKIGLNLTPDYRKLFGSDFRAILPFVTEMERLGIYKVEVGEHLLMGDGSSYPYSDGDFPIPLDDPWADPISFLSAVAAVTQKIRLGTAVLITPLRPPALLAKQLATLDSISQGRVDLGVGVGWMPEEYEASGIPFPNRGKRLDDTIAACKSLWTGEYVSFDSDHFTFNDVISVPKPVQKEGIPILFSGKPNEKTAHRIADWGAGWIPLFPAPDELKRGIDLIKEVMTAKGRDANSLRVSVLTQPEFSEAGKLDLDKTFENIETYEELGVTEMTTGLAWCVSSQDDILSFAEALTAQFR